MMDAEIKVLSAENLELSKVPSFKPVGHEIAVHAMPADQNSAFSGLFSFTPLPPFFSDIMWLYLK